MSHQVQCPHCSASFSTSEDPGQQQIHCPVCFRPISPGQHAPRTASESADADEYRLAAADEKSQCPICQAVLAPAAVLCIQCGYNRKTGVQLATAREGPAPMRYTGPSDNPYASPAYAEDVPAESSANFTESDESEPEWEGGASVGAYIATTRSVLFRPVSTFSNMVLGGSYYPPITYALATYFLVTGVNFIYQLALGGMLGPGGGDNVLAQGCCAAVCVPIFLLIWTAALHTVLYCSGPLRGDFDTTLRVVTYCDGATRLLAIIPVVGVLLHQIAHLIYSVIGIIHAHQVSPVRAICSVLAPFLLWIALVVALVMVITSEFPEPGK